MIMRKFSESVGPLAAERLADDFEGDDKEKSKHEGKDKGNHATNNGANHAFPSLLITRVRDGRRRHGHRSTPRLVLLGD